jgi:hypothetical protein
MKLLKGGNCMRCSGIEIRNEFGHLRRGPDDHLWI